MNSILEQRLQQFDHRRFSAFGLGGKIRQVEGIVAQFVFQLFRQRRNLIGTPVHQVQSVQQLAFPHYGLFDGLLQNADQLIVGKDVQRIRHAHEQFATMLRQHDTAEPTSHGFRKFLYQLIVELVVAQLNKRYIELTGQDIEQAVFVHIAKIRQRLAKLATGTLLLAQGRHQLLLSDNVILNQQVA